MTSHRASVTLAVEQERGREPELEDRNPGGGSDCNRPLGCPEAVGRLIDRLVRPGADDPLIALFERTAGEAWSAGLTEAEIEAELAAYNAEHRI